jgi:hypothetical protein
MYAFAQSCRLCLSIGDEKAGNAILASLIKLERDIHMRKMFSKKMAFVYGGLSVCVVIGFIVAVKLVADFQNLYLLPIDLMPVTHMVQPLLFVSIVLGGLAALCRWGVNKPTVSIVLVVGILLTVIFKGYWQSFHVFGGNPRELANDVIYNEKVRNYDLGHGVVIAQSLCVWDGYVGYLIEVYEATKIYEQDGESEQKRQVGLDALQPGQMVDINGAGYISDPEFTEFLYAKYDPAILDQFFLLGATEITIHKGKSLPLETNMENSDCYDFLSAP